MQRLDSLQMKTLSWADDRNLIKGSTPKAQMVKLIEEFGELCSGVSKNNIELIKDSIGDVTVVLTILCEQQNVDIEFSRVSKLISEQMFTDSFKGFNPYKGEVKSNLLKIIALFGALSDDIESETNAVTSLDILYVLSCLEAIAKSYKLTLIDCFAYAYDQIKDRKGRMVDGVFVKEADLCQAS